MESVETYQYDDTTPKVAYWASEIILKTDF